MIVYVLICIIFALIIFTVLLIFKVLRIAENIEEVTKGNFNERIRIHGGIKSIKTLIINLNRLIDEFQRIVSINKRYEEDRKKMISNISHDFRTPLTSMLGYVEMLINEELSEQERKEYLKVINSKGMNLRDLIEEFFTLSKIDSEDIMLELKKVNITETIRQSVLYFIRDFERNNIVPAMEIPEKDIYINADEKAILRILQNIIANSLRYGAEGKTIGIGLIEEEDSVVIEIWDNGRGIPQDEIINIFERLYTVDKSRNWNNLRSSGIGLTIVKKLVEKHSGSIEVSSEPYKKTAFKVTLPKS